MTVDQYQTLAWVVVILCLCVVFFMGFAAGLKR